MHTMFYGGILLVIASQCGSECKWEECSLLPLRQKGNSTNSPHVFSVIGSASVPMVQF